VVENSGWNLFPAVYMMAACAIGMVAVYFLKETAGVSIRGTEIPSKERDLAMAAQAG
ncbi:MAG: MFS transporter, partial [Actinomycetota bacterium]|nr:MFS transporter [Actinomycetota bacterium]